MRISKKAEMTIDQEQLENVEYFKYLGSMKTNDARCTRETKSSIVMAKGVFCRKKRKLVNCNIWSTTLYGAETLTLRKVNEKLLENFKMWCWGRIETNRVRNQEVLHAVKKERNIPHATRRR